MTRFFLFLALLLHLCASVVQDPALLEVRAGETSRQFVSEGLRHHLAFQELLRPMSQELLQGARSQVVFDRTLLVFDFLNDDLNFSSIQKVSWNSRSQTLKEVESKRKLPDPRAPPGMSVFNSFC